MKPPVHNVLLQIKQELPSYSSAFKKLANFILAQTFQSSSMSIDELANAAGVSVATVNRFTHKCGYHGYPAFKVALRSLFNRIFEPIEKARSYTHDQEQDTVDLALDSAIHNLQQIKKAFSRQALAKAVSMILEAKTIFVAGMGVSTLHASFLVDALEPLLPEHFIKELSGFCGAERAFRRAATFNNTDLFIAISLPRYSQSIVDLTLLARNKHCKILALTDQPSSPLFPLADEVLLASSSHPIFYATNVSMMALIELIATALTQQLGNFADNIAQQTQTLLPYFYLPEKAR